MIPPKTTPIPLHRSENFRLYAATQIMVSMMRNDGASMGDSRDVFRAQAVCAVAQTNAFIDALDNGAPIEAGGE